MKLGRLALVAVVAALAFACGSGAGSADPAGTSGPGPAEGGADAGAAGEDATVDADARGDASQVIPVSVVWSPKATKVMVELSIGGSAPIMATIDTGSVGIKVLASAVPASAWQPTTTPLPNYTYGGAVVVHGVAAQAAVSLGGVSVGMITVYDVTSRTCTPARPGCDTTGATFANGVAAIVGIGMRSAGVMASPLLSLSKSGQVLLSLPKVNGTSGTITVDPSAADVARFGSRTQLSAFAAGSPPPAGVKSWDDTQMPFCVNQLCARGILDTGGNAGSIAVSSDADYAALGVPSGSTTFPAGAHVTETIDKSASWSFDVGAVALSGVDLFAFGAGGAIGNNIGPAPFYVNDVLYDYTLGQVALAPKK